MPLGLKPGERLVSSRTDDIESYQQYLRDRAAFLARRGLGVVGDLEKLVARNPGYAPAWALLARIYSNNPFVDLGLWSRPVEESRKILQDRLGKAEKAARE